MSLELPIGAVLSGYRIERELGRGATGTVYLARDEHLDRPVALKVLPGDLSRDERFRARFLRESRVAATLEHPSIVPIYGAGEADGLLYLAMRYVEGGDLRGLLEREGRLDLDRTIRLLTPVADALDAAHDGGLIHRDVKPGNILVGRDDRSYLADFGLAKHAATVHSLSREGIFSGTVDYVAPEQIQGEELDGRVDTYALACVMFETLAGRPPFERDSDLAVVFAHLKQPPPSLSALRPELPEALDAVIARGMAKNPDERPRTASRLIADAAAVAGGGEVEHETGVAQLRTFLIADVRGYTRYTQQHGDEAAARLAATFAERVGTTVRAHEGRLIELRGDEALVVFESARNALRAAMALQAALADEEMARGVGVGLDAGEAVPVGKGYRGGALNMAARLCSLAEPGEVLASEAVVHLARKVDGIRYLQGRVERLKGIDHPVRVVEVVPQERAVARLRQLRRRMHGRRWPLVAGAAVIALVAAAAAVAALRGGGSAQLSSLRTVAVFDTGGRFEGGVPTGVDSFVEQYYDGAVWSLDAGGSLAKINPTNRQIEQAVAVGNDAGWTFGGGAVWVNSADKPYLTRVDAQYGSTSRIVLPRNGLQAGDDPNGTAIAYGAGSLWVAQNGGSTIARIDPATGKLERRYDANGVSLLRFGDGALYAVDQHGGNFERIDPRSGSPSWSSHIHPWIADVLPAAGFLWLVVDSDAGVYRFSEQDGSQVGYVHTGAGSGGLAYGAHSVWVSNWRAGTVTRVNTLGSGADTFATGNAPTGLTVTPGGDVFVGITPRPPDVAATLHGTAAHVVLREDWLDQNDVGNAFSVRPWELEYATQAKLYNYPDWPGTNPSQPVPEIAAGYPTVTHHGGIWRYTIPVRTGYRFSPPSNAPVTAESMRYTLERSLSPKLEGGNAPGEAFLGVCGPSDFGQCSWQIVGQQAFVTGHAAHLRGLQVRGNALVIETTAPVPDIASRLAMPFFGAVPIGTPLSGFDPQQHPIPSAGPYYVSYQNIGWQTVLRRNPNYHGPRPHRLDAIVYDVGIDTGPAANRVKAGTLDYESETYPDFGVLAPGGTLAHEFASARQPAGRPWYASIPTPGLDWLEMNTSRGLFAHLWARKAVDLAVDRPAIAALSGGVAANQYLPTALLTSPSPPPTSPTAADLARARALLRGRHANVTLLFGSYSTLDKQYANIIRDDLARIGLHVIIRPVQDPYEPDMRGDMRIFGWQFDYWDPADLLPVTLFTRDPATNPYGFQSTRWERADDRASQLTGAARLRAFSAVARGVHALVPWVVLDQRGTPAFFSARLGCIHFPPAYAGVDLAALCVRH